MTFANLSQATAASKRVYHRTQNTFNRIQNTYMSIEIHHQGWLKVKSYDLDSNPFLAQTSFCWAFSISTMLRHSLNYFLGELAKEQPSRFDRDVLIKALQYLNSDDFHKRLRNGFLKFPKKNQRFEKTIKKK